jgi:hypothetical protein
MPMDSTFPSTRAGPTVLLVGEMDHPDFAEAVPLLRASAEVTHATEADAPELILLAASRPGVISPRDVERLRRRFPLAGWVALVGSWCEGETRTGRPPVGVRRLYWYEFPGWWHAELARWAAGRCPAWAWTSDSALQFRNPQSTIRNSMPQNNGLVVLDTTCRETGDALTDVLRSRGLATVWSPARDASPQIVGALAGIWEGRQLDDAEALRLENFCRRLQSDAAPVIALLDFPRRDRCQRARELGAAAVLGKPWQNADLLALLERAIECRGEARTPPTNSRAA